MFKSSKIKKIISFMLVAVLAMSAVVLPTSAEETTTEEEYVQYIDLSEMPEFKAEDLDYIGKHSDDVSKYFNLRQEYDMSAYMNEYYTCIPFKFYWNLDYTTEDARFKTFDKVENSIDDLFTCDLSSTLNMLNKNFNFNVSDYDVYYVFTKSRSSHYGMLQVDWYYVPHGKRISFVNQALKSNLTKNKYGVLMPVDAIDNPVYKIHTYVTGENSWQKAYFDGYSSSSSLSGFCSYWGPTYDLIATNMPVFDLYNQADAWRKSIGSFEPSNKIPEPEEEKIGADAFYWDSLKCKLVRDGDNYKIVFDYKYSVSDMVANPSDYVMYVDVTQDYKYKAKNNSNILNGQSKVTSTSCDIGASPGRVSCDSALFYAEAYGSSLGSFCVFGATAVSDLLGHGYDWADITFYNSYISVYVELVHNYPADSGSLRIKDKVSSDIRSFSFDALTLKSVDDTSDIDSTENEVNVKTKDTVDDTGKVTDRRVESVVVNDTTTNQTINNYYYDGNGNKSDNSSGNGSALNDILSGLISFIKTLVTEGLPAAIEILKTVIKSISDLVSSALDGLNVGEGTSNGIIAVLKCIPASCWSLVVIAVIILVVVGVLKHIF